MLGSFVLSSFHASCRCLRKSGDAGYIRIQLRHAPCPWSAPTNTSQPLLSPSRKRYGSNPFVPFLHRSGNHIKHVTRPKVHDLDLCLIPRNSRSIKLVRAKRCSGISTAEFLVLSFRYQDAFSKHEPKVTFDNPQLDSFKIGFCLHGLLSSWLPH